jgi:hypothetical protein
VNGLLWGDPCRRFLGDLSTDILLGSVSRAPFPSDARAQKCAVRALLLHSGGRPGPMSGREKSVHAKLMMVIAIGDSLQHQSDTPANCNDCNACPGQISTRAAWLDEGETGRPLKRRRIDRRAIRSWKLSGAQGKGGGNSGSSPIRRRRIHNRPTGRQAEEGEVTADGSSGPRWALGLLALAVAAAAIALLIYLAVAAQWASG